MRRSNRLLKVPGMRHLRDDGPVPGLNIGRSRQGSGFIVDKKEVIIRPVDVIQAEIDDSHSCRIIVLSGSGGQPAVIERIIHLAVHNVRIEFAIRQPHAIVLIRRSH